jgi:hypothetical protein
MFVDPWGSPQFRKTGMHFCLGDWTKYNRGKLDWGHVLYYTS